MFILAQCLAAIAVFLFVATVLFLALSVVADKIRDRAINLAAHREICKLNQMFYTIDIEGVTYVPRDFDRSLCTDSPVYRCELAFDFDSDRGEWRSDSSGPQWAGIVQSR